MSRLKLVIIVIINVILQSTIFSRIDIYGVNINISIAAIVALSYFNSEERTSNAALILGLLEDISYSNILGVRALVYYIFALVISKISQKNLSNQFVGIIQTVLGTFFILLGEILIYTLLGYNINLISYLSGPIIVEMIANSILYLIMYRIFNSLTKVRGY